MNQSLSIFLFISLLLYASCTSESEEMQDLQDGMSGSVDCADVTFSQDVQSIINTNCAVAGCHVTGTTLPDFSQNSVMESRAAQIKSRTANGSMPPPSSGLSLSKEQVDIIACWVDNGGKTN